MVGKSKELIALRESKCDATQMENEEFGVFLREEQFTFKLLCKTRDEKEERALELRSQDTILDLSFAEIGDKCVEFLAEM